MNTLTALLAFASHITVNSTADGGWNELTNACVNVTITYGNQKVK